MSPPGTIKAGSVGCPQPLVRVIVFLIDVAQDGAGEDPYVPLGGSLIIHPHQFILAAILEYIRLPPDLMSYVIGRSTSGRLGLIVATAVGIQPGFAGTLTLELRNLGETPPTLYPGQAIGQLFFHNVQYAPGEEAHVPGIGQHELTRRKIAALTIKNAHT